MSSDRTLGHRLAGEWLQRMGEHDPVVLAEHFELGGERARAAALFVRARAGAVRRAEEAYEGLAGGDLRLEARMHVARAAGALHGGLIAGALTEHDAAAA